MSNAARIASNERKSYEGRGRPTFTSSAPCEKCGTYVCRVKARGRGCVECHRLANAKRRAEQADAVRAANRESYNRNRPAHSPEQLIVNTVRRSGTLETAPHNQDEFLGVVMRTQQLKELNGQNKIYTLDHDLPAAGIEIDGVKYYGRATAENLKPMEIKANQVKSNSFDKGREITPMIATKGMAEALRVGANDTTEELRARFIREYGYSTKSPSGNRPKNDLGEYLNTDSEDIKARVKTAFEVAKALLVCELRLCGHTLEKEPASFAPVWSEDKGRYVPFAIPFKKDFYPVSVQNKLLDAYHWLQEIENQKFWFKIPGFAVGLTPPAIFESDECDERIQNHFAEWVSLWQQDRRTEPKAIFDICHLVDVPLMRELTRAHTEASLKRLDSEKSKYGGIDEAIEAGFAEYVAELDNLEPRYQLKRSNGREWMTLKLG